jgi:hypothetical protein
MEGGPGTGRDEGAAGAGGVAAADGVDDSLSVDMTTRSEIWGNIGKVGCVLGWVTITSQSTVVRYLLYCDHDCCNVYFIQHLGA